MIKKFDYIDLTRGVAILLVILVHSHQTLDFKNQYIPLIYDFGQLGVQLFFLASALTLCLSFSQRKESDLWRFYIRRLFRIAPLYYFGIAFYLLWRSIIQWYSEGIICIPEKYEWVGLIQNIFFVHGLSISNWNYFVPGGWSISVEMIFYLFFPFIFKLYSRFTIKRAIQITFFIWMMICIINYIGQRVLIGYGYSESVVSNNQFSFFYAFPLNQLHVFLIGVVLYKCIDYKIKSGNLLLFFPILLISFLIFADRKLDTGVDGLVYTLIASLYFSIFISVISKLDIRRIYFGNMLTKIGKRSFSMYLMHFFVLDIIMLSIKKLLNIELSGEILAPLVFITTVALTYITAKVTEVAVEKPGIKAGARLIKYLDLRRI